MTALRAGAAGLVLATLLAFLMGAMALALTIIEVTLLLLGTAIAAGAIRFVVRRVNRLGDPLRARRPTDDP